MVGAAGGVIRGLLGTGFGIVGTVLETTLGSEKANSIGILPPIGFSHGPMRSMIDQSLFGGKIGKRIKALGLNLDHSLPLGKMGTGEMRKKFTQLQGGDIIYLQASIESSKGGNKGGNNNSQAKNRRGSNNNHKQQEDAPNTSNTRRRGSSGVFGMGVVNKLNPFADKSDNNNNNTNNQSSNNIKLYLTSTGTLNDKLGAVTLTEGEEINDIYLCLFRVWPADVYSDWHVDRRRPYGQVGEHGE